MNRKVFLLTVIIGATLAAIGVSHTSAKGKKHRVVYDTPQKSDH
jgi:hypothetical protein